MATAWWHRQIDMPLDEADADEDESGRDSSVVEPPEPIVASPRIGRNQPCPCGSGKKYKKCCGRV